MTGPGVKIKPVDRLDDLADFCREFPAWVGRDGLPLNWRFYLAGMMHLARARAREQLRAYDAAVMAQAKADDRRDWVRLKRLVSGDAQ